MVATAILLAILGDGGVERGGVGEDTFRVDGGVGVTGVGNGFRDLISALSTPILTDMDCCSVQFVCRGGCARGSFIRPTCVFGPSLAAGRAEGAAVTESPVVILSDVWQDECSVGPLLRVTG